jgi:hypothetical protein
MKAIWRGQVIAESDRTLEVGGYRYFPRETHGSIAGGTEDAKRSGLPERRAVL